MATQITLLLIVFTSSVIATLVGTQPKTKGWLVALSAGTVVAAIFKAHEDKRTSDFIRGALAAQLASSNPAPAFRNELLQSLNRVAEAKGLRVVNQFVQEENTLFLLVTRYTDNPGGVVRLNLDSLGEAYLSYMSKKAMDGVLKGVMYNIPQKGKEQTASIFEELGFVGKIAIGQALPWLSATAQFTMQFEYEPARVGVNVAEKLRSIQATLDAAFLNSIAGLPPYARNWKAYEEFQRQVELR